MSFNHALGAPTNGNNPMVCMPDEVSGLEVRECRRPSQANLNVGIFPSDLSPWPVASHIAPTHLRLDVIKRPQVVPIPANTTCSLEQFLLI